MSQNSFCCCFRNSREYSQVYNPHQPQKMTCQTCCYTCCTGRTPWYITIFVWPFVLFWQSLRIFLFPCISLMCGRCLSTVCCYACRNCCNDCYMYTDDDFRPEIKSLATKDEPTVVKSGEFKGMSLSEVESNVKWLRCSELATKYNDESKESKENEMRLFKDGIEPADVCQGALGDCWLLAAIASLAEFPGAIQNCFKTLEASERGKYNIRIYDARKTVKSFKTISVDDFIPCLKDTNKPIFSTPKGNEMWVLLLEKAFAKFCGGYSALKGGHAMWAFEAITGNPVFRLDYNTKDSCWERWSIEYEEPSKKTFNPKLQWNIIDTKKRYNHEAVWELLLKYDKSDALICGSVKSSKGEDKNEDLGIVAGHTYTIKKLKKVKKFKLLQLRNPWGDFEWKGDWSDDSKLWDDYPEIKKKCDFEKADDGMFWIEYNDFFKIYNVIQVCDRDSSNNLHINVNEDLGFCGVAKGCCVGCFGFWCCCEGCDEIYCGHKDVENQKNCCGCNRNSNAKSWTAKY